MSTLLRGQYYKALNTGSYLDDSERSRMLHDLTVPIGDVCPDKNVAHVGSRR